jgi:hypothetical protein
VWDVDDLINLRSVVDNLVGLVKGVVNDNLAINSKLDNVLDKNVRLENEVKLLSSTCKESIERTQESIHIDSNINSSIWTQRRSSVTGSILCNKTSDSSRVTRQGKPIASDLDEISTEHIFPEVIIQNSNCDKQPNQSFSSEITQEHTDNRDANKYEDTDWKTVTYARKVKEGKTKINNQTKPLIGTKGLDKSTGLKTVSRKSWLFISRLDPSVTEQEVKSYVEDCDVRNCEIVELKPKYNSYKSFKLGIPQEYWSKVFNSEFWPSGTLVREFTPPINRYIHKPKVFLSRTTKNQLL